MRCSVALPALEPRVFVSPILAPTTGELGDGGGRWRGQVEGTRRVGEGLASRLSRPFPPILTILLGSHTWPLKVALIGSPVPMSQEGCGGVQGGLKVGGHALRAAADLDIGARSRPQLEREVGVRDSGLNTTARRAESNATPCTFNLAMSARASTLGRRIFRPSLLGQRIETTNCGQRIGQTLASRHTGGFQ